MAIRDTDYKPIPNVPLRSPLAIGGFFLHFLRTRFSEPYTPGWIWREDDTETELFIVASNTIENEIRNNRPAIYVILGQASSGPIVIGNRSEQQWFQESQSSYGRITMGVTINCESANRGESHMLSWHVFSSLLASQDVIRAKYHIANMGPFDLVPPRPSKKDKETYISTVNFGIQYELSWNVTAVQTCLKEISLSLDLKSSNDPTGYLQEIYVNSIRDTVDPGIESSSDDE